MSETHEPIETCRWHPKVETPLHCYQCDAPICTKCARRTPVGYICPDCYSGRKRRFEQSRPADYVVAAVVAVVGGGAASLLSVLGWFVIFLSPLAGGLISEVVWRLVGRRYGQHLWWIVAGGILLGTAPILLGALLLGLGGLIEGSIWGAVSLLWPVVHTVLAVGSAVARLRMR